MKIRIKTMEALYTMEGFEQSSGSYKHPSASGWWDYFHNFLDKEVKVEKVRSSLGFFIYTDGISNFPLWSVEEITEE